MAVKYWFFITSSQLDGTSVVVKVLKGGGATKIAVLLREPCYNIINNSALIFQNNGGQVAIPFSQGHCRETYYGELEVKEISGGQELLLSATGSKGGGCEICK